MADVTMKMSIEVPGVTIPLYRYVPVPRGGIQGQSLLKLSNADFDFDWGFPTGGGGDSLITAVAGETLSALRVVRQSGDNVYLVGNDDTIAQVDSTLGVTLNAGGVGAAINIARSGYVEDNNWSWQIGRVYLGLNGFITQVPPTTGFLLLLGSAVSPTKILLNISQPIGL